jgi:pimeloyl-ACP methyl ester carboxylesterase
MPQDRPQPFCSTAAPDLAVPPPGPVACRGAAASERVIAMDAELLSDTFVDLADTLVADFDVIDFLHLLTDRSVALLPVSAAGVLLADPRGQLRAAAASSEAAGLVELFQIQNDQGPCLDCFRTRPAGHCDRPRRAGSALAAMADYIRCFSDPGTIAGSCADYRAAASTDLTDDDESFSAGQKIGCPVLVLWGSKGFVGRAYEPLSVWQEYAADVRGNALPTGHFLPEEAPDLVLKAMAGFLGES